MNRCPLLIFAPSGRLGLLHCHLGDVPPELEHISCSPLEGRFRPQVLSLIWVSFPKLSLCYCESVPHVQLGVWSDLYYVLNITWVVFMLFWSIPCMYRLGATLRLVWIYRENNGFPSQYSIRDHPTNALQILDISVYFNLSHCCTASCLGLSGPGWWKKNGILNSREVTSLSFNSLPHFSCFSLILLVCG